MALNPAQKADPGPARDDAAPGSFAGRLANYRSWRDELMAAIAAYREWLGEHENFPLADLELLERLTSTLNRDKLTLALVGEFSRGKSELLNALFFSEFDQRLLPSAAGRTTMCPTELRFDETEGAYVRLLPIETRKTDMTIADYRKNPVHWQTTHILRPNSFDEVHQAFLQVTRTKKVHVREAQELGLYDPGSQDPGQPAVIEDKVEVPLWRHAIINFPHPLLRQGLVILDTPGLNALGAEPELTLSMLPLADAILFLLGADTGVTQSDLAVWKNHVTQSVSTRGHEHIVVLNKIDILWDNLTDEGAQDRMIAKQLADTAKTLGIDRRSVFALSAKTGLTARVRKDPAMLDKSGLKALEIKLTEDIIPGRYEIIRRRVVFDFSQHLTRTRDYLQEQLKALDKQMTDLKAVGGKNAHHLQDIIQRTRSERARYDQEIVRFQEIRKLLASKAEHLFDHLGMASFNKLAVATRDSMKGSWTTHGLRSGMSMFFRGISDLLDTVRNQSAEIQKDLNEVCDRLHQEFGLARVHPAQLSLVAQIVEMKKLEARAEAFRTSAAVIVTEQNRVIERFFVTMVGEARQLFEQANALAQNWFREVGTQIFGSIQAHKESIDRELATLRAVHDNIDGLSGHLQTLEGNRLGLKTDLDILSKLQRRIEPPVR